MEIQTSAENIYMGPFSIFHLILILMVISCGLLTGCSLEANIENLAGSKILPPAIRHDKDFQQAEVAKSGHYEVHGQVGEIAEKKSSGQYVIEGVIAYE